MQSNNTAKHAKCLPRFPYTSAIMLGASAALLSTVPSMTHAAETTPPLPYVIIDTGQVRCYDDRREIKFPKPAEDYFGQDAQYLSNPPRYRDNGDGTVTDLNTGLMWQADPGNKKTYAQAVAGAARCRTGGYSDWRLPTIKQLYSLIQFDGLDPDPCASRTGDLKPFIDTRYFKFRYGNQKEGDRIIDSQWATSTIYRGSVINGQQAMFGVNFADGRIKGYPTGRTPRGDVKTFFVIYVRGSENYGHNVFVDNGDKTVTDRATGLTWMQIDSGALRAGPKRDGTMDWKQALAWAEQLEFAGHDDWRLPTAKELQSIVDYRRSPQATNSPAIDPIFQCTAIRNESGQRDYAHYWTSTSHNRSNSSRAACYIAFGRALGFMRGRLMDVHGAGAQRSDDKTGDPSRFATGRGPQGDVVRINNMVRLVRGGNVTAVTSGPKIKMANNADHNGPNTKPTAADFIRRLDRNRDGNVSHSEFDGPSRHFRHLDRNNDGVISSDEAPTGPPPDGSPPPPRH